jgi:hypothetical protein
MSSECFLHAATLAGFGFPHTRWVENVPGAQVLHMHPDEKRPIEFSEER